MAKKYKYNKKSKEQKKDAVPGQGENNLQSQQQDLNLEIVSQPKKNIEILQKQDGQDKEQARMKKQPEKKQPKEEIEPVENPEITTSSKISKRLKREKIPQVSLESKSTRGAMLKKVRQERKISLDVVQEDTKIPLDALRAIEEGYTVRRLPKFYYEGFLKIYAKYLNVDITKVADKDKKEKSIIPPELKENEFNLSEIISGLLTHKIRKQIVIAFGVLLTFVVFYKIISFFRTNLKDKKEDITISKIANNARIKKVKSIGKNKNALKVSNVSPQRASQKGKNSSVNKKKKGKASKAKKNTKRIVNNPVGKRQESLPGLMDSKKKKENSSSREKRKKPAAKKESSLEVNPLQGEEISDGKKANISLTIRATKKSWLRVKVDKEVVFQSTLKLGAVETWIADDDIEISGRNLSSLEFELNGKMIGKLGRMNRKVKRVIINKDGLQVSK